jgi:hypothetical protein
MAPQGILTREGASEGFIQEPMLGQIVGEQTPVNRVNAKLGNVEVTERLADVAIRPKRQNAGTEARRNDASVCVSAGGADILNPADAAYDPAAHRRQRDEPHHECL